MRHCRITDVKARQIFDSRGRPTVEVDLIAGDRGFGRAAVPSGASTGTLESLELRDGEPDRYAGLGVQRAVRHVVEEIRPALLGRDVTDQPAVDRLLIELDGSPQKRRLGANALLGVSLAAAKCAADLLGIPLYRYLGGSSAVVLPVPMVNMISGGLHAGGNLDMQDFLMIPAGAPSYLEAMHWVFLVYRAVGEILAERRQALHGLADEGGFGPNLDKHEQALEVLEEAFRRAGLKAGEDVWIGIDAAASHYHNGDRYELRSEGRRLDRSEMVEFFADWVDRYPILSIEDGMAEEDWAGWQALTARLGDRTQLIGDDLFVTHVDRLERGIRDGAGNAVLVKVNQVGTLSEATWVVQRARQAGFLPVISARSGETEDAWLADLAVGLGAGQIKIGSIARSERGAKYNQLLRIEEALGPDAGWPGVHAFGHFVA